MLRRFASVMNPATYGYSFDSEAWTANAPVDTNFRMYQTYGDGNVQHSGDWAITVDYLADYLISLAQAMGLWRLPQYRGFAHHCGLVISTTMIAPNSIDCQR